MAKGVFLHRTDSIYEDRPEEQYQFPKRYLKAASACKGDWIVYLEPVKAGRKGYYAIARVSDIIPDPVKVDHHVALIEPGSYLPFEQPVPFVANKAYPELSVLNDAGRVSGRAQAAMRIIPLEDFDRIIDLGFRDEVDLLPRDPEPLALSAVQDTRSDFVFEVERERVLHWTNRAKRDRVFRKLVLQAYDSRCALTGLKLINGGGRAEVEAAHIRPVEHGGPDIVSNGLPLCGTVHWMFDRGLISLTDDLEILISRHVNDVEGVRGLLHHSMRSRLPTLAEHRPHPRFLGWHRENCFKQ